MSRYIDADALIEYLKKIWGRLDEDDWYEAQAKDALEDDIEIVNKQPTVDAVQVVRCRECVHGLDSKRCGGAIFDDNVIWCTHIGEYFTKDHYCADGERRTER